MSELNIEFLELAVAWVAAVLLLVRMMTRSADGSIGLPYAFLFSMTFLYIGFISYIVPGYTHMRSGGSVYLQSYDFTEQTVLQGMWASLIGVIGYVLGTWLLTAGKRRSKARSVPPAVAPVSKVSRRKLLWCLGLFGFAGFILTRLQSALRVDRCDPPGGAQRCGCFR